jgi:hypothetical protein
VGDSLIGPTMVTRPPVTRTGVKSFFATPDSGMLQRRT